METQTASRNDTLDIKQLLAVLTAVKKGDFRARMPIEQTGVAGKIADTLNDIIELNERMTAELARVASTVGKEGKTTQRLTASGATGAGWRRWSPVNTLIADLVHPTHETARVIGAVAKGDLSQTMALESEGRPLKGEFLRTAKVVNGMVEQLGSFRLEVTRVAREVGTEGKLGGQATGQGRGRHLEGPHRLGQLDGLEPDGAGAQHRRGHHRRRQRRSLQEDHRRRARRDPPAQGHHEHHGGSAAHVLPGGHARGARGGHRGKLGGQAVVLGVAGTWKDLTGLGQLDGVEPDLAGAQHRRGDHGRGARRSQSKDHRGRQGRDPRAQEHHQHHGGSAPRLLLEVTRVAREVGTEGKLGGQAEVPGVAGTWKDLTDSVNLMASNLTGQVRNIAEVTTAVAKGDLGKKITVDVKGEILELKNTINTMVDQ
jgi:HAMP domain-containing protein